MLDESVTVLLAVCDQDLAGRVQAALEKEENVQIVARIVDPSEAVQSVISAEPDIVIICESENHPWHRICNFITLASPRSKIILLAEESDAATISTAMLLGIRQVLTFADGPSLLPSVIARLQAVEEVGASEEYLKVTDPHKFARLIGLSGAKGGVGKTTIAVNLGVALARKSIGGVVIWDAYSQFGDVASIMSLSPTRVLAELGNVHEDVEDEFLLDFTIHHESGADVLLTSDTPIAMDAISPALAERVIAALRKRYRFIVADIPPIIHPTSILLFSRCWRLLVVTTLKDFMSVSDAIKLVKALEPHHVTGAAVQIVPNRMGRGDSVKEKELESLMGRKVIQTVPDDPQVIYASNVGRPICDSNPQSPAARAIRHLADLIVEAASSFGESRDERTG